MPRPDSAYYPPRAGSSNRLWLTWWALRRRVGAHKLTNPWRSAVTPRPLLILLLPAYGFAVRGNPVVAIIAAAIWSASGIVVLVFLGQTAATVATAEMVGIHATGIICALHRDVFPSMRLDRVKKQLVAVVLLVGLVYMPSFMLVRSIAFPLYGEEGLVIINGMSSHKSLQRGDIVGYRFRSLHMEGERFRAGYGLDPVLALPGDLVAFHEQFIRINGHVQARQPHMPQSGEFIVPEKHWFIWPRSIRVTGDGEMATRRLQNIAVVPKSQVLGKPFTRWFWRKQIYEPVQ